MRLQSAAIDVWSAGVVLLCILARRYPFFNAPDDLTALVETACVLGQAPLQQAAQALGKELRLPPVASPPPLPLLCRRLAGRDEAVEARDPHWPAAYNLLARCLVPNPQQRISAAQALNHPFLVTDS